MEQIDTGTAWIATNPTVDTQGLRIKPNAMVLLKGHRDKMTPHHILLYS